MPGVGLDPLDWIESRYHTGRRIGPYEGVDESAVVTQDVVDDPGIGPAGVEVGDDVIPPVVPSSDEVLAYPVPLVGHVTVTGPASVTAGVADWAVSTPGGP